MKPTECLAGADYPHLCTTCQLAITLAAKVFASTSGPDHDNPGAPYRFVKLAGLLCEECADKPETSAL